jgi:cytochrome c556
MKSPFLASAMIAGVMGFGAAQAQAPVQPVNVVEMRKSGMALLHGATYRGLNLAVASKAEPKNFEIPVRGIVEFGKMIPSLFPEAAGPGNRTLPAAFSDRAGFENAAKALVVAAEELLKITRDNNAEAFPAAVKAVTDSCGGCHPRTYARSWIDR